MSRSDDPSGARPRRRLLRRLTFSAATLVILFGLAEMAARLFHRDSVFLIPDSRLGYGNEPGFRGSWGKTRRVGIRIDERGFRIPDRPRSGESENPLRIAFLGDSCTFGFDVEVEGAYPERLADMIRTRNPQMAVEVLNCGVIGYSTRHGARQFHERVLALRPNIVTMAYSSANRIIRLPSSAEFTTPDILRADPIAKMLRWSKALNWIYDRALGRFSARHGTTGWDTTYSRDKDPLYAEKAEFVIGFDSCVPFVTLEEHQKGIESVIETAKRYGIQVVLLAFGENPLVGGPVERGEALLEEGKPGEAVAVLEEYFARDKSAFPYVNNLDVLANHLFLEARRQTGREDFSSDLRFPSIRSSLHGISVRTHRAYATRSAKVSKETGVPFLDLREEMEADPSMFFDFVHFDARGHEIIARALYRLLEERRFIR